MTDNFKNGTCRKCESVIKSFMIPAIIFLSLSLLILLVSSLGSDIEDDPACTNDCRITLVETMPEGLTFPVGSPLFPSTFSAWKNLLMYDADVAAFYWSLRNEDVSPIKMPSAWKGEYIFNLMDTMSSKGINYRIAQNAPSKMNPQNDSEILAKHPEVEVRSLDFNRLVGAGVLHTKMVISKDSFYLGSANMDWRSLTQVKEVGVYVENCSCLANDLKKVFEVYWILGKKNAKIPTNWPVDLWTKYNLENPMHISFSGQKMDVVISSSPLQFNPSGRANDLYSLLAIINSAEKFIHIAVMDYFPRMLYSKKDVYWSAIDNELRKAALERQVEVHLLASHWNHTRQDMVRWLKSLQDISGTADPPISIETRLFIVPVYTEEQREIPFARVNHNKYMVTDKTAYIGTSNWSGDYFVNTAGISISISENNTRNIDEETNIQNKTIREQLESLFQRDWNSQYAHPV